MDVSLLLGPWLHSLSLPLSLPERVVGSLIHRSSARHWCFLKPEVITLQYNRSCRLLLLEPLMPSGLETLLTDPPHPVFSLPLISSHQASPERWRFGILILCSRPPVTLYSFYFLSRVSSFLGLGLITHLQKEGLGKVVSPPPPTKVFSLLNPHNPIVYSSSTQLPLLADT